MSQAIAGGAESSEGLVSPTLQPETKTFTEEEVLRRIEEARKQEKDKLYGKVNTLDDRNKQMAEELAALTKEREDRQAKEAKARTAAEAETKRLSEEKLSAQELVEARAREFEEKLNQERTSWEQKFSQIEQQREQEKLIAAKEREFNELATYIQSRARDCDTDASIHPSLLALINGNSKEEVEQSIELLKVKTNEIVEDFQQVTRTARSQMQGVSTAGYTNVGPESNLGSQKETVQDIRDMTMAEWAKNRHKFVNTGSGNGRGMF